jgi:hypothetical protein
VLTIAIASALVCRRSQYPKQKKKKKRPPSRQPEAQSPESDGTRNGEMPKQHQEVESGDLPSL